MARNHKRRTSAFLWVFILLFLATVITFPRWITLFYPQPNRELVFTTAYEYNIDPYLVFAIIRAESKYQTGAKSAVGARGLMQIMPETAVWIASQMDMEGFTTEDLHDPDVNIRMGCWYLNSLMQEFEGRLPIVIAAYNAGRGKAKDWVASEKWDGTARNVKDIPFPETRQYVRNVLKNYQAYHAIYDNP
ncbi:MAG TPA: lytic transglycosylase domain-containing protein [Syntrophomonadaceae bacterium]|nr:lytic transglycosylase domain-containing protein [Syntrophomonadaceae bacterium]